MALISVDHAVGTRRTPPSRTTMPQTCLARVDAEMARRHGSAPSVAAEAKR